MLEELSLNYGETTSRPLIYSETAVEAHNFSADDSEMAANLASKSCFCLLGFGKDLVPLPSSGTLFNLFKLSTFFINQHCTYFLIYRKDFLICASLVLLGLCLSSYRNTNVFKLEDFLFVAITCPDSKVLWRRPPSQFSAVRFLKD